MLGKSKSVLEPSPTTNLEIDNKKIYYQGISDSVKVLKEGPRHGVNIDENLEVNSVNSASPHMNNGHNMKSEMFAGVMGSV